MQSPTLLPHLLAFSLSEDGVHYSFEPAIAMLRARRAPHPTRVPLHVFDLVLDLRQRQYDEDELDDPSIPAGDAALKLQHLMELELDAPRLGSWDQWDGIWPDGGNSRSLHDSKDGQSTDPISHEASSAKIWAVYVSEAHKYDRALVESWRSNMDGMLIFAGLFSASLTAFIIESYKTLNSDSGDMTVILLRQISQQIAATANGSSFSVPPPAEFVPPVSSLVCNALCGRGIFCTKRTCALRRASAPAYSLYYGLKRFNMHVVVEVIPLLLHASLVFFFAGLVAFLLPVNTVIMVVSICLLTLIVVVYAGLTILPLFHLDCPYRTPFSGPLWRLLHSVRTIFPHRPVFPASKHPGAEPDSVVAAVFQAATAVSEERAARDCRALIWTIKSLANTNTNFEPFVEGIPDILWSPQGRRHLYDTYIMTLVAHPEVKLMTRIEGLLQSAQSGLLPDQAATRRRITCLKAIWAIASLSQMDSSSLPQCDLRLLQSFRQTANASIPLYAASALALARWTELCAIRPRIQHALRLLGKLEVGAHVPDIEPVLLCFRGIQNIYEDSPGSTVVSDQINELVSMNDSALGSPPWVAAALQTLQAIYTDGAYLILVQYLLDQRGLLPYEYGLTRRSMVYPQSPPSHLLSLVLDKAIYQIAFTRRNANEQPDRTDAIIRFLASLSTQRGVTTLELPRGLITYFEHRGSEKALRYLFKECNNPPLWSCLTTGLSSRNNWNRELILTGLWHLAYHTIASNNREGQLPPDIYEDALAAVVGIEHYRSGSVVTLLKTIILDSLLRKLGPFTDADTEMVPSLLKHPLLPHDTAIRSLADIQSSFDKHGDVRLFSFSSQARHLNSGALLWARIGEAHVTVFTEFLESCGSTYLPSAATKTIRLLRDTRLDAYAVHASHQIRLATSLAHILQNTQKHTELIAELLELFVPPADPGENEDRPVLDPRTRLRWLDNATARKTIVESWASYASRVSSTAPPLILEMLENVGSGWS
ncbi:hypothetical protein FB451DRAFT_1407842 [Mycena latifolia]|nr:hypothetical protein FB451DRAFT_1407842 [Mycena latifolia]